jgi:hypothetical protein
VLIFAGKNILMVRPKVLEILNEKFRDHSNTLSAIPEGYISAFWDHDLEKRIGSQGLSQSCPRHEVGLGTGPVQSTATPTIPGMSNPVALARPWSSPCMAGGFGCAPGPLYGLP